MSTDNPKVSGYVPQHIYDRFKTFCEERGISMSQAVTVIFAEYFGLDLAVNQNSSTSGLLVERVGLLEQELAALKGLVHSHLQLGVVANEKDHLVACEGSPPEAVYSEEIAQPTSVTPRELLGGDSLPEVELPEVIENVQAPSAEGDLPENTPSELVGGVSSELPNLANTQDTEESVEDVATEVKVDNPLYNLLGEPVDEIKPIPGIKLSKLRFGLSEAMIAGKKRDKPVKEFTEWTKDRDPDGIAWKYVLTPSKGYLPVSELSSELRDKLLTWMRQNGLL